MVTVEIDDPYEITPTMWDLVSPDANERNFSELLARDYRAGDWRHYQIDPGSFHTKASVGKIGPICFVRMWDRQATDMVIG